MQPDPVESTLSAEHPYYAELSGSHVDALWRQLAALLPPEQAS